MKSNVNNYHSISKRSISYTLRSYSFLFVFLLASARHSFKAIKVHDQPPNCVKISSHRLHRALCVERAKGCARGEKRGKRSRRRRAGEWISDRVNDQTSPPLSTFIGW